MKLRVIAIRVDIICLEQVTYRFGHSRNHRSTQRQATAAADQNNSSPKTPTHPCMRGGNGGFRNTSTAPYGTHPTRYELGHSIIKVAWEPSDDNLTRILIPKKINGHAITGFFTLPLSKMPLQKSFWASRRRKSYKIFISLFRSELLGNRSIKPNLQFF